jgi:hypothetical protein
VKQPAPGAPLHKGNARQRPGICGARTRRERSPYGGRLAHAFYRLDNGFWVHWLYIKWNVELNRRQNPTIH